MKTKKVELLTPQAWEGEAVDFIPVETHRLSKSELQKYAKEAQTFIFKTMTQMEVRPRRSFVRRYCKES